MNFDYEIDRVKVKDLSDNFKDFIINDIIDMQNSFTSSSLRNSLDDTINKLSNQLNEEIEKSVNSGTGISNAWQDFSVGIDEKESALSELQSSNADTPLDFKGVNGSGEISKVVDDRVIDIVRARKSGDQDLIDSLENDYADLGKFKLRIPGASANPYAYPSQCTGVAWQAASEHGVKLPHFKGDSGNAKNWYSSAAAAGYSVGSEPRPNSIAVYPGWGDNPFGHVAYVKSVNYDNRTIVTDEALLKVRGSRTISFDGLPPWAGHHDVIAPIGYIYLD